MPVPEPLAICQDAEIIGAPFYLMRYVDGLVLRTMQDGELLSPAQAAELSDLLAQMLATIHGVDLAAAGLDTFGRPEGYLARQLSRWQRQWELSNTREMPGYDELVARLTAGLPDSAGPRARSCTVTSGWTTRWSGSTTPATIAAVVDWEMSTLGDPLADLGPHAVVLGRRGRGFPRPQRRRDRYRAPRLLYPGGSSRPDTPS